MSKDYDPKEIEAKWQKEWENQELYRAGDNSSKEKHYFLVEFPYPSGNLHVGHWYAFSVPDIAVRFHRMNGKNVLYPIGFDAFGLPAENAAIQRKLNPREWTLGNIDYMKNQLRSMGASFDWSREVITCDPEYYKWTQWMFTQFFEKGLAYQAEREVNWCPKDKTVLANEQVVNGQCERCGTEVVMKNLLQWNLKITDYADRLLNDLEKLDWPKPIKESQKNWIGKSEGALIKFDDIEVFTTRPDTIFGATFLVKAGKEDKFTGEYVTNPATQEKIPVWEAEYVMADYGTGAIMAVPAHDERDYEFAKKHNLPIRHAIMPVLPDPTNPHQPGKETIRRKVTISIIYDSKSKKYLTLKWKKVPWRTFITGGVEDGEEIIEAAKREIAEETGYTDIKFIRRLGGDTQSHFFATHKGVNRIADDALLLFELNSDARQEVSNEELEKHEVEWITEEEFQTLSINHSEIEIIRQRIKTGRDFYIGGGLLVNSSEFNDLTSEEARSKITEKFGKKVIKYKLRDWVVSRQRYWGVPIPVIHCDKCGPVAVPVGDLPVILPEIDDYLPRDDGKSPLSKAKNWVVTKCPKCGGAAHRETDTLDTFVDSSWYFLRYTDPKNKEVFAARDKMKKWLPVDFYSGGAEHTTMHLLYSRFWHKALFDLGLVNESEPYLKRMNRGLIMGPDGQKMSKSKGNVIDPDKEVERLGADTVRTYLAFIGPYNEVGAYPWNPDSSVGVRRFLERVWRLKEKTDNQQSTTNNEGLLHQTIKKVGEEIVSMKMNTAVSALMILVNSLDKREKISQEEFEILLKLLAPFAPHMTEELWQELGHSTSIHEESWPQHDEGKLVAREVTIVVQVNGKVRASFIAESAIGEQEAVNKAMSLLEVQKWVGDKAVKKSVYVPGKLVNIVIL